MDTIADLLTRIRNALQAKHKYVDVSLSKMNRALVDVLIEEGFVQKSLANEETHMLRVFLRYTTSREPLIQGLRRMSKPGLRRFVARDEIPSVKEGLGIAILSTPQGILTGKTARTQGVGGELLCTIW